MQCWYVIYEFRGLWCTVDDLQENHSPQFILWQIKSGVPLSPIWSPVDARAESEYFWGSQESINREGDAHDSHSVTQSLNELSEQMVRCMINIYRHLVDPNNTGIGSSHSGDIPSPTSPFGALANSSASSLSESSLLSITRSPLVDLRRKEEVLGTDATPDPYKARGKVPWAEIGPYARALEVPWLSVGKDQLEYAAQALGSFRWLSGTQIIPLVLNTDSCTAGCYSCISVICKVLLWVTFLWRALERLVSEPNFDNWVILLDLFVQSK